ncbi:Nuclear pore complex protein Nup85 [Aphelenchoides bicaudatus]|nr:Nuclear pore complex protein Nup85 [Aphelenchoides bicaudatus]
MVNYDENGQVVVEQEEWTPLFFANAATNSKFLQTSQIRQLIIEFHGVWSDVQKQSINSGGQLSAQSCLEFSRAYRAAINIIKPSIVSSSNTISNEILNAEILWSLVEEVYLKPADIPISLNLISWSNNCFNDSNKLIDQCLADTSETPEENEFYWNSIILSIFRVNLNIAARLLRKHSRFEKDGPIQQICFLLESFHAFVEQGLPNASTFLDVQRKVRDMIQTGSFRKSEQLNIIAGLLIGKNENYEKCARMLFDNWYELLPAYVLFACPGATIQNVGRVAQTLYNNLCPTGVHVSVIESLATDIDRPIFSILCRNLIDMLKQICEKSTLWWFPTHLIDLFYHFDPTLIINLTESFPALKRQARSKRLAAQSDENNQPLLIDEHKFFSIRSAVIIDYGHSLLNSRSFWIISSDYLNSISAEELGSEPNLTANLDSVKEGGWFVDRYVKEDCLSEALCWALRSKIPELINLVSSKLLLVSSAEEISNMRIFDAMDEAFYTYPILLLLQRFYEFRRCLSNGQAPEAVARIHELITSGIAPINFQLVLFDQMTKLLDSSEFIQAPQLDPESLYDLMKAINKFQIQNSIINPPQLQKDNAETLELNTKIKFFRSSLCNALASRSLS